MIEPVGFPVGFYISLALLVAAGAYAWRLRDTGVGIPMLAVLATVGAWYLVDAVYNDYQKYVLQIGEQYLEAAWWQVALFLVAFTVFVPIAHKIVNKKLLGQRSHFMDLMHRGGIDNPQFQRGLDLAMGIISSVWFCLMFIALIRTNFDFLGLFAPYVAGKAFPWSRWRVGGTFDALLSFANYLQVMLTALFGVVAALSNNPRTRLLALTCFLLAAPFYLLDRARNLMLATFLPGLLAWVGLRLRTGMIMKVAVLVGVFLLADGWMKFVLNVRSSSSVSHVFSTIGVGGVTKKIEEIDDKHAGLNMFGELAWINKYIDQGTYRINYGQRYFAELVNPIPRGLWANKPKIGIDYALARGQAFTKFGGKEAGVGATISTGMIGQGVVNFGTFFGVLAAALIMAFWVAILARQDLKGDKAGRLLLFFMGCVMTFNLGRDVTLITLYPFLFGWVLLTFWAQFKGER